MQSDSALFRFRLFLSGLRPQFLKLALLLLKYLSILGQLRVPFASNTFILKDFPHDVKRNKEGFTDGEQSGLSAGLAEAICDLLSDVCRLPNVRRRKIMAERDPDTLKTWLKIARRAESLDAFLAGAGLND